MWLAPFPLLTGLTLLEHSLAARLQRFSGAFGANHPGRQAHMLGRSDARFRACAHCLRAHTLRVVIQCDVVNCVCLLLGRGTELPL